MVSCRETNVILHAKAPRREDNLFFFAPSFAEFRRVGQANRTMVGRRSLVLACFLVTGNRSRLVCDGPPVIHATLSHPTRWSQHRRVRLLRG